MYDFSHCQLSASDIAAVLVLGLRRKFTLDKHIALRERLLAYGFIFENAGPDVDAFNTPIPNGTYSPNKEKIRMYFISLRQNFYRSFLCPAIVAFITAYFTVRFSQ